MRLRYLPYATRPGRLLAQLASDIIDSPGEAVRRYVEVFGTFTGS
ncbi:hypothetical protein [Mycolicibacterium diernhoferi]|nr:hypothetical protein [Mycolicibacterium diernhoferi]